MADHIDRVEAFLHAYWEDDTPALAELVTDDLQWDNVPFHSFRLENGQIVRERNMVRQGLAALGSKSRMLFRDIETGEPVYQDSGGGGHDVLGAAVMPNGTVYHERDDIMNIRGAIVRMRCLSVFEFRGDRISLWRDNFEINHWTGQLALLGIEYAGYATDKKSAA